MNVTTFGVATAILLSASTNLAGQTVAEHIARGDSAYALIDPAAALEHYRSAHLADPQNYEAIWKFARSQVDVANTLLDRSQRKTRDSLYGVAAAMAEGAIYLDSTDAEGHAILATAVGQLSRTKSGRERVRYGKEIYETAAKALELDPAHSGAHHVIGAWHAEVTRLSGITRFIAKTFMGGGYMGMASRDSALAHLQRATEIRPDYVFHHLELAEILIDLERLDEARSALETVLDLPPSDLSDSLHKERASQLIEEISEGN